MNEQVIQRILSYGQRYFDEQIKRSKGCKDKLMTNHWEALRYLLGKVFYQGRRDAISERVRDEAVSVLKSRSEILEGRWTDQDFAEIEKELKTRIGRGKVGKGGDVKMVIGILSYLLNVRDRNIVKHTVTTIEEENVEAMYRKLTSIYQIGPKIASFFLRDMVQLFEIAIRPDDLSYLQPVDTWVSQVAIGLELVEQGATPKQIEKAIIAVCADYKCSPLLFNQGAWYLGANAFELLLEDINSTPERVA
jgi:endonuclease III